MKREQVNIRDPFIMLHENTYYLYGTRSATCWGDASGFDCYTSQDLENWDGPFEIFKREESFWATQNFWAPECYFYNKEFYLIVTFGSKTRKKGIQILKSNSPKGPFAPITEMPITNESETCIDATLYVENGTPYIIYSDSFEDSARGAMRYLQMSEDLVSAVGQGQIMFYADTAPWSIPVPFAKAEFGIETPAYFTDGPFMHKEADGTLYIFWSSWGEKGYTVGIAKSDNGTLKGNWSHLETPLANENSGHGMVFKTKDGTLMYTMHSPNDKYKEAPVFHKLVFENKVPKLV